MANMGPTMYQIDLSLLSSSLGPLAPSIGDRLNIGGNPKCLNLELEFMVQYDKDNYTIIKSKPINIRHIVVLPFLTTTSSTSLKDRDRVAFMMELNWVQDGIQLMPMHPN